MIPTSIIPIWFSGLLSLSIIGGDVYLLREWSQTAWVYDGLLDETVFNPDIGLNAPESTERDMAVAGPELGAQALQAGLVDELQMIIFPAIVGGGKRFFPEGMQLDLVLAEERRFDNGVVVLWYAVRS